MPVLRKGSRKFHGPPTEDQSQSLCGALWMHLINIYLTHQLMYTNFYAFPVRYFIAFKKKKSLCGFNLKIMKNPKRVNHYLKVSVHIIPVFPFSKEHARTGLAKLYHAHESLRSCQNRPGYRQSGVRVSISNKPPGCRSYGFQELHSEQQGHRA